MSGEFHTQGPVPINTPAYVPRRFEEEALQQLLAGQWVLLLGPRQHGKTTGLYRLKERLREADVACAVIDLQAIQPVQSFQDILRYFAGRVARQLGKRPPELADVDYPDELISWLKATIESGGLPVVLLIDEASAVRDPEWRNALFGQIRSIASERAEAGSGSVSGRLRFLFAGTFRPETLVSPLNSPLNVCHRIETDDLTVDQAVSLWKTITDDDAVIPESAFSLVGGQPYLLQSLFSAVTRADTMDRLAALEECEKRMRQGVDDHFDALFSKVLGETRLAELTGGMVRNGSVPNVPGSSECKYLQVLGIAKRQGDKLVFRNRIYEEFARSSPQLTLDETRSAKRLPSSRLILPDDDACNIITDVELREIALAAYRGAVVAYNGNSYRLSLAGFGAATEAVLMDWLAGMAGTDLSDKVNNAIQDQGLKWGKWEDCNRPETWTLANMLKVARSSPSPVVPQIDVPNSIRNWRNMIHPAVAKRNYLSEAELEPEARIASGLIVALIRDIEKA